MTMPIVEQTIEGFCCPVRDTPHILRYLFEILLQRGHRTHVSAWPPLQNVAVIYFIFWGL